jgi:hypothetical protein
MGQDSAARGADSNESRHEAALAQVQLALRGLRFGTITITVQDGVVVQIERTEKFRLKRSGGESSEST